MADKQDQIEYEVQPVQPGDLPPPPSYEEVMGQYVTSVRYQQTSLPRLAYIDIMPRLLHAGNIQDRMEPTFQTIEELVTGANSWLKDNPGMSVWKCETVERKVKAGLVPGTVSIDVDSMVQHEATFGFNCFVIGLRMWLTPKVDGGVQELGIINVLPGEKEIDITIHHRMYGRGFAGFNLMGFGISQKQKMITYDGLKKSVEDFNNRVKGDPIPGSVLNIETATLKFGEGRQMMKIKDAASAAMWFELNGQAAKRYTQILRVFFIKGSPTKPEICVKEFLPRQLSRPTSSFQPIKFDSFGSVIDEASGWIQQQAGISFANLETRNARVNRVFNDVEIDTDSGDHFEFGLLTVTKLRMLRIFYIPNPSVPSFAHTVVTSRLFVPRPLGGPKFESMTQTMARIEQWMQATGLPIFGVETVSFLKGNLSRASQERCDLEIKPFQPKHWVNAIRVYFPSGFEEPDPNPFPPNWAQGGSAKSSSCSIL